MPVPCARCNMPLPKWELATGGTASCALCGATNRARVFPAALVDRTTPARAEAALEGEASCFDHPGKRAVAACGQCGRFVCQLCAVEFGEAVWCPTCVSAGAGQARAAKAENARTLYDSTALIIPLLSIFVWPFTIITAPATVVLSLMRWRRPLSLVRRFRWRFVLAILIATGQMMGWVLLLWYLFTGNLRGV